MLPLASAGTITVNGTGFTQSTIVSVNGVALPTNFVTATQVTAGIAAGQFPTAGSFSLTVSDGGTSASTPTIVLEVTNPAPGSITLGPSSADGGGSVDLPFVVAGSNFVSSSVIQVDGAARATKFISSTQLSASLSPAEQASAHVYQVAVSTPAPGGGVTASVPLTIRANPVPVLSSFTPTTAVTGTAVTLDVVGSNFVSSSTVTFNGSSLGTQFVSSAELKATIDASLLKTAGSATIAVSNPPPVGGQSAVMSLQIDSAVPKITSVLPAAIYRTSTSTTLTLQGTGFQPTSIVLWNGNTYSTTFISSTQLSITVPQADVPSTTSATLQVSTPAPGGGQSGILTLPVYLSKPTITAVQEGILGNSCQQIQLSITGQNLPTSSIVATLNGATLSSVTSYGSTMMVVRLPANLGVVNTPQLIVQSSLLPGAISDPFTVSPTSSVCFSPASILSFPGTAFGIDATMTALGTNPVMVSALALPTGFAASTAAPYTVPGRIYVTTDASLAPGTYSIGLTPSGMSAVTLPVTLASAAPSFSFLGPQVGALAVPVGGSSKLSVSTYSSPSASGTPDFRVTLNATGLPQGVTASFQPSAIIPGDTFIMTLTADGNAPVRQNVPISIVGTIDGTSVASSLALTLSVSPIPGTIADNRTAYTWTGGTPNSVAYDSVHNLIFASNPDWNRIDIILPSTHAILRSIPVASPVMIDLSQDSGTLWIGTQSQQVYALDTSAFTMRTYTLPTTDPSNVTGWTVSELYSLADGNLLVVGAGAFVWSPSTGAWKAVTGLPNGLMRSPDGTKVFGLTSGFSGCQLNVYSTATSSAATYTIDSGFTGSSYCGILEAANHDGSILVASLTAASLKGIQLLSGTGQSLGSFTAALSPDILSVPETVYFSPRTFVFSDDGNTLYQTGGRTLGGSLIATYDVASRKLLGLAPAISSPAPQMSSGYGGNTMLAAAGPSGLLIGIQAGGVAFEDSTYFQDYGTGNVSIPGGNPTVFTPQSGPLAGGSSFSVYPFIVLQPDVWYGDVRGTASLSSGSLTLTSPAADIPGPVDLKLIYPNGELGYGALGFSYGPSPRSLVYNGSGPAGGAVSALTGFGLPADSGTGSISVGGSSATITSTVGQYPHWTGEVVPTTFLKFNLPSGRPGYSDLQVQTPNGVATLPKAVFYASSVNDYSLSGTASSVLYDKFRKRAYVITKNSVQVFDTTSNSFLTPITAPTVNGVSDLRDGALSIDGTYLVIGNGGDGSVAVLNLDSPGSSYALALPKLTSITTNCAIGPGAVATLANNKALILPTVSSNQCGIISNSALVDLQAGTQTTPSGSILNCPSGYWYAHAQSNADGTQAVVDSGNGGGACFYFSLTGYSGSGSLSSYFGVSIAPDGNVLNGGRFTDSAGKSLGKLAQPTALYGPALTPSYPADSRTVQLPGSRFNASGGLHFEPHVGYFEIVDTRSATLRMRFSLTETVQSVVNPMAIDEGGREIFLLTDAGLTVVDLRQALLSVGHLDSTQTVSGGNVQVRGSGFDASTAVTIDSAAAIVKYVDENTLTITMPQLSSGAHDLTVTRADGSTITVKGLVLVQ